MTYNEGKECIAHLEDIAEARKSVIPVETWTALAARRRVCPPPHFCKDNAIRFGILYMTIPTSGIMIYRQLTRGVYRKPHDQAEQQLKEILCTESRFLTDADEDPENPILMMSISQSLGYIPKDVALFVIYVSMN